MPKLQSPMKCNKLHFVTEGARLGGGKEEDGEWERRRGRERREGRGQRIE